MLYQYARNPLLSSTANYSKFITNHHLEYATISQAQSLQVIHHFLGKLNRGFCITGTIVGGGIHLSTMRCRTTRINVEADESLGALIYTSLNAIQEIITTIRTELVAGHHYLKAILLKLLLARNRYLPCKVSFTLAISLSPRVKTTMARIKRNYVCTVYGSARWHNRIVPICGGKRISNRRCQNQISRIV